MIHKVSCDFAGRPLTIETGRLARQTDASVLVTYGETIVLVTVVVSAEPTNLDFLPLRVDFEEKMYAVGRIPGGFFKREGRPSTGAILTCRKTDRPIRPLLPAGLRHDVQVIATALSAENQNSVDLVTMTGASAAMHLSSLPFAGPFATAQIGREDDQFIINPSFEQLQASDLDLLICNTADGILMAEMEGHQVPEEVITEGIKLAQEATTPVLGIMEELREQAGRPKRDYPLWEPRPEITDYVREHVGPQLDEALQIADKMERQTRIREIRRQVVEELAETYPEPQSDVRVAIDELNGEKMKKVILEENRRIDGRDFQQIRPISCEVGLLPRTHGSGLFTRGETQVLTTTTLGPVHDQKLVRTLEEEEYKRFMHHYNFPPFCVGETRALRGPARREIGHGNIGQKALESMLPPEKEFPYTIRLVSEVLESNGSSSMAGVCGSTLALMDAGVEITAPVAGIAVGLIYESDDNYALLTDIQGIEDHAGHMDFKVAGTRTGINVLHLDMKVPGLPPTILAEGLEQARAARLQILDEMAKVLPCPRTELSRYAPRMYALQIPRDAIGLVIGPGGKQIRALQDTYEVEIDIEDDGTVFIFGINSEKAQQAYEHIRQMTREIEVGEVFTGTVVNTTAFGAFVEISPGREGLIHISHLAWEHVNRTEDVVKSGDEVKVKVIDIDDQGKIRLSRKELLPRTGNQSSGDDEHRSGRGRNYTRRRR